MSRSNGHDEGRSRGREQREPDEPQEDQPESEREAEDWAEETGYRPSVNQRRDEPMPASHQADHGQEAVLRNEEHNDAPVQAEPSPQGRRRS